MPALELLFGSWIGLLSVFTVVFAIGMIIFLATWAVKKVHRAEEKKR
ncbi:MAG: DUF3149 domain-containing protein [Thiohalospira sp.]